MYSSFIRAWGGWRTASALGACLLIAYSIPKSAQAENASRGSLPEFRPAFVGSGPSSLVNLIDAKGLIQRGQGHGAMMFYCVVRPNGSTWSCRAYGGTPDTEKLKFEIKQCLNKSMFIPAVYNHQKVYALFYGTVVLSVIEGKPRLRVFANQEQSELEKESDFIAPQPFSLPKRYYEPRKYPEKAWSSDDVPGIAVMLETVDASGKLTDLKVVKEIPPGNKFGENALKWIRDMTFLPAFRNGRAVESTTHLNFIFIPNNFGLK